MTVTVRDLAVLFLTAALLIVTTLAVRQQNRIDDLEERMTTFETVRIEAVVQANDSG